MKGKVVRVQTDKLLRSQSVPPLLPAYNKYMGGVDRTGQLKKTYGFDRKSKRSWVRLFFHFFDIAVNNAYILYKHNCKRYDVTPIELLDFRVNLAQKLIGKQRKRAGSTSHSTGEAQSGVVCRLEHVSKIRSLTRGRCQHCLNIKKTPPGFTSFGCSSCKVRLCKTACFSEYHSP